MDALKSADCLSLIKAFEKSLLTANSEEGIFASLTIQLSSIQVNSASAAANLQNLISPPTPKGRTEPNPASGLINAGKFTAQETFNKVIDPEEWRSWLEECIPCDLRIDFKLQIVDNIDDTLLNLLEQIINGYLKQINFILNLLNATDVYGDICPLLFATQDICIPDIQRILSLLASILYRISVRELESVDIIKLLITPLFQPLFLSIFGLLSQYKLLVTDPLQCVVGNLNAQLDKLKTSDTVNQVLVDDLTAKADALGITSGVAQREQTRAALNSARQPFADLDAGINALQNGLGATVFHLRRLTVVGIGEIEALVEQLKLELASFLGVNENETVEFLLNQYQKLMIFRLISFLAALIKAKGAGFNCNFDNPVQAEDSIGKFLNDFLGPNAPVIVTNVNGSIELITNPELTSPIRESLVTQPTILIQLGIPDTQNVLTPSGDTEASKTFDGIISSTNRPIPVKPTCMFDNTSDKLADWIKELDAIGV